MSNEALALALPEDEFAPVNDVTVMLVAELDRARLPFMDVASWVEGSLVTLPSSAGETIAIYVGEVRIGSGEVLVVDGVLTVRVSDLVGAPGVPEAQETEHEEE